jgi:hypothetical protein
VTVSVLRKLTRKVVKIRLSDGTMNKEYHFQTSIVFGSNFLLIVIKMSINPMIIEKPNHMVLIIFCALNLFILGVILFFPEAYKSRLRVLYREKYWLIEM